MFPRYGQLYYLTVALYQADDLNAIQSQILFVNDKRNTEYCYTKIVRNSNSAIKITIIQFYVRVRLIQIMIPISNNSKCQCTKRYKLWDHNVYSLKRMLLICLYVIKISIMILGYSNTYNIN